MRFNGSADEQKRQRKEVVRAQILAFEKLRVQENIEALKQAVELSETQQDYVTRDLVQEILEKEEEYWDWLDTQLDLVENVGIENYIQSQI